MSLVLLPDSPLPDSEPKALSTFATLALLMLTGWNPSPAFAASPNLEKYELVFSDEFNGTELNPANWNTGLLWGPYLPINNEKQMYIDTLGMHQGFEHSPFQGLGRIKHLLYVMRRC